MTQFILAWVGSNASAQMGRIGIAQNGLYQVLTIVEITNTG
jgi:hypothetical protein